jgi:DNA-directed RNA polymerase alpha subunit
LSAAVERIAVALEGQERIQLSKEARDRLERTSVHEISWSARVGNVFENLGIKTIADLLKRSRQDLMRERNFGTHSYREVVQKLAAVGLELSRCEKCGHPCDPVTVT